MRERAINDRGALAVAKIGATTFTNPRGVLWAGKFLDRDKKTGIVRLLGARRIEVGLYDGSADRIGWYPQLIRQVHVGQTIAAFLSLEGKQPGEHPTTEQIIWRDNVNRAGGLAGIFTNDEQAIEIATRWERFDAT